MQHDCFYVSYLDKYDGMSTDYHASLLLVILEQVAALRNPMHEQTLIIRKKSITFKDYTQLCNSLTSGGKVFSAARRGTEKPPWVLVSLAVSVLQKNSVWGLVCFNASSDACNASLSYCINETIELELHTSIGTNLWR